MVDKQSLFKALELPDAFGVVLLIFFFILLLSPYFSGADFGIFKIPIFTPAAKKWLKIIGPIVFGLCLLSFAPIIPMKKNAPAALNTAEVTATPQQPPVAGPAATLTPITVVTPQQTPIVYPTPTITPTPLGSPSSDSRPTQEKKKLTVNDVSFELQSCRREETNITCQFIITRNKPDEDERVFLYPLDSQASDSEGEFYRITETQISGGSDRMIVLAPNTPAKAFLRIGNVPTKTREFILLRVVVGVSSDKENVDFRNVFIIN